MTRHPLALAIVHVVVSLAIEAGLMIAGHLTVPRGNAILAPVVLTLPPVVAAWIVGYRRLPGLALAAVTLSGLTLVLTVAVGRLTGISTGLAEPIAVRATAGWLAGYAVNRWMSRLARRPGADTRAGK